ncbi:MAG: ABC transporter substrate-binding protein [Burkholderiales bacterium]
MSFIRHVLTLTVLALAAGCGGSPWNDPYPASESRSNTLYTSFSERPKHLDPVQSYAENEYAFIANIYQPPLQYHYLKRPFELIPFGAEEVPRPQYLDAAGRPLPESAPAEKVAFSEYVIRIRKGLRYQPHPAFAVDEAGRPRYHALTAADLRGIDTLADFKYTGTRELEAADYVHQIKRLGHPRLHSPILQLMTEYIAGLKEFAEARAKEAAALPESAAVDLTRHELEGVRVIDRHSYAVRVRGKYPQFAYWLAMPFFAPVPPEADRFYGQPGMAQKNITLDWYPVGTGPYMLTVNNPNRQMVLERNPNYSGEVYPAEGEADDAARGLLADAGKPLPFIDRVVFSLEKEQIPYWNKFLQGYYDASGIASDTFDQAVQFGGQGDITLTEDMAARGIRLQTSMATTVFYLGFNMLDPVVGEAAGERARKLRLAISIAVDQEEFISIFRNGRGVPSHGPIPPGIFGYRDADAAGINPYVYEWRDGKPRRKNLAQATKLLAEAGYPNGRDAKTGQPLLLHLDTTSGGADSKPRLDWYVNQFSKLGVQLVIRATDFNRLQDKLRRGTAQLYFLGWNADYPDPENFLFLLHGAQGRAKTQGENASNYRNAEYDRLFDRMKHMANGPERQAIIDRMVGLLRHDAPWVWSFFPRDYTLHHAWVYNRKPNQIANNGLKYQRLEPALRAQMRREWNPPVLWPLALIAAVLALSVLPAVVAWRRRERRAANPPAEAA